MREWGAKPSKHDKFDKLANVTNIDTFVHCRWVDILNWL